MKLHAVLQSVTFPDLMLTDKQRQTDAPVTPAGGDPVQPKFIQPFFFFPLSIFPVRSRQSLCGQEELQLPLGTRDTLSSSTRMSAAQTQPIRGRKALQLVATVKRQMEYMAVIGYKPVTGSQGNNCRVSLTITITSTVRLNTNDGKMPFSGTLKRKKQTTSASLWSLLVSPQCNT